MVKIKYTKFMSAFILKLVDESIVPAVLLFATKVIGLILTARFLGISLTIADKSLYFARYQDLVLANNISNIMVGLVALIGTSIVLIRLYHFHDSHIHPSFLTKLLESDLEFVISTSFDLFHQVAVWLSLGFFITASFFVQAVFGLTSPFILFVSLFVLVLLCVMAVLDFEREVKIESKGLPSFFVSKN